MFSVNVKRVFIIFIIIIVFIFKNINKFVYFFLDIYKLLEIKECQNQKEIIKVS
jgi:hypothetical protein